MLNSHKENKSYVRIFLEFSSIIEQYLIRVVIILFAVLLIVQLGMQHHVIRQIVSRVELLEGTPYGFSDIVQIVLLPL